LLAGRLSAGRLLEGRLSFGLAVLPDRLLFGLLPGEFIGALFRVLFGVLFGALFRTVLFRPLLLGAVFGVLPRVGGVKGRKPSFGRALFALELSRGLGEVVGRFAGLFALFAFAGVSGRFPGVAGPRASRGEMAGA
jgi:hypothetical protein